MGDPGAAFSQMAAGDTTAGSGPGGRDWADRHIGVWNVAKIAGLLGQDTAVYDAALAQIEGLKAAIGGVPTIMGRIATIEVPPLP